MPDRPTTAAETRQAFLDFFREKGHEIVESAPLVPQDDPTLLFINAGMNPFKDVFLGTGSRPYVRVADTQKCLRVSGKHNDLEEVGHDTYHHTFFEMLGNWSFGDYFKKEAIAWAWELLVDRWGLDPDRLYATVHEGDAALGLDADTEAAELWLSETSIPPAHVLFQGSKDNFWMMGDTGPCGPCSEIHYDMRSDEERAETPGADLVNQDHPEVIEIWNLVFIQYNAQADGSLDPLKAKHVDTGMGFERLCAVLQGKRSNYDIDLFQTLLAAIAEKAPEATTYEAADEKTKVALRVVADHLRTLAFAIADGAQPGNTGRGYVIRRILRRAVRYGYQTLGFREPFLYSLVGTLGEVMGDAFPEIVKQRDFIERVIKAEEEGFLRTLGSGLEMFDVLVDYAKSAERARSEKLAPGMDETSTMVSVIKELITKGAEEAREDAADRRRSIFDLVAMAFPEREGDAVVVDQIVSAAGGYKVTRGEARGFYGLYEAATRGRMAGEVAFLLHDTYGFPSDLTALMAREQGLTVDEARFDELMQEQKD
ncbi:MAG: alanine--tRNA ligase, partial [Rubricoccaceae bacterium]|nr:alanine--tRNA ligase [Rubricoccaceae bacterium]